MFLCLEGRSEECCVLKLGELKNDSERWRGGCEMWELLEGLIWK